MPQEYIREVKTRSNAEWGLDRPFYAGFEEAAITMLWGVTNVSGTVAHSSDEALRGKQSCKINTGLTTPLAGDEAFINKSFGIMNPLVTTVEFQLNNYQNSQQVFDLQTKLSYKKTGKFYRPGILLAMDGTNTTISIYTNTQAAAIVLETVANPIQTGLWQAFSFRFNPQTEKLIDAVIFGKYYDLSSQPVCTSFPIVLTTTSFVTLTLRTLENVRKLIYVDDFVVDQGTI